MANWRKSRFPGVYVAHSKSCPAECRHTYASLLMAAGYTIKELMEYMGHADLQMVNRYVKLLPQPGEDDAAARLNDYLRRSASDRRNA
jgi:integrase